MCYAMVKFAQPKITMRGTEKDTGNLTCSSAVLAFCNNYTPIATTVHWAIVTLTSDNIIIESTSSIITFKPVHMFLCMEGNFCTVCNYFLLCSRGTPYICTGRHDSNSNNDSNSKLKLKLKIK